MARRAGDVIDGCSIMGLCFSSHKDGQPSPVWGGGVGGDYREHNRSFQQLVMTQVWVSVSISHKSLLMTNIDGFSSMLTELALSIKYMLIFRPLDIKRSKCVVVPGLRSFSKAKILQISRFAPVSEP